MRVLILLLVILEAHPALAVQVHGGSEGLIVHMLGHCLFLAAVVFLLTYLANRPLGRGRAWRYLRLSLFLFLLWNLDTMVNHLLGAGLLEEDVMLKGFFLRHYVSAPLTFTKWAYYLTSFDHLLCVPAIFFLFLSMREFAMAGLAEGGGEGQ